MFESALAYCFDFSGGRGWGGGGGCHIRTQKRHVRPRVTGYREESKYSRGTMDEE